MTETDLTKTVLNDADLRRANLTGAYSEYADFDRANLSRTTLHEAYMVKTNFTGANLTGADFRGSLLEDVIGANFAGALNVP